MDADLGVVYCAGEVVSITAGQASIAWLTAGLSAVVGIPVLGGVMCSHESLQVLAVFCVDRLLIVNFSRADCVIVHLKVLFLSASLIDGEDPV